jgi:hypothetical protein
MRRGKRSKTEADPDPSMATHPSGATAGHCGKQLSINWCTFGSANHERHGFWERRAGRILDSLVATELASPAPKAGAAGVATQWRPAFLFSLQGGRLTDWTASRTVQQHPPPSRPVPSRPVPSRPRARRMFFILPPAARPAAPHRRGRHRRAHVKQDRKKQGGKYSDGGRASETTGERLNILRCQRQVAWLAVGTKPHGAPLFCEIN